MVPQPWVDSGGGWRIAAEGEPFAEIKQLQFWNGGACPRRGFVLYCIHQGANTAKPADAGRVPRGSQKILFTKEGTHVPHFL